MSNEELINKLTAEAKRYPHGFEPRTHKEEVSFIAGGQFGYSLAQPLSVPDEYGRQCICNYLDEPCSPRCTCVNGESSVGCMYCATYGSIEQRKNAAKRIAGLIKAGLAATPATKEGSEDYWPDLEKKIRDKFEIGERGRTFKIPIDELMEFLKQNQKESK